MAGRDSHSRDFRIDAICDEFESALKKGEAPRLEEYLESNLEADWKALLWELLGLELEYRRTRGESVDPEDYVKRFPHDAAIVESVFRYHSGRALQSRDSVESIYNAGAVLPEGGRYRILREAGRGAMGVVYEAQDTCIDRTVAIKILHPGPSLERFRREAQLPASIRSQHVVIVYDFHELPQGMAMLVLEWIDGKDIGSLLQESDGPLPEDSVLQWMLQTCLGMKEAADTGVVHRDLKPANILVDGKGDIRVTDFGLAVDPALSGTRTAKGSLLGTPHYMAPEQAENPRAVDTRADIYSFGATFYHILTGAPPFTGESAFSVLFKNKTEPLLSPKAKNPSISQRTNDLLERCLAKSPDDRFQSFGEILHVLQAQPSGQDPWIAFDQERIQNVLSRYFERRPAYLSEDQKSGDGDVYEIANGRTVAVLYGNIAEQVVDAVVSSDDESLSMGGGVSWAIRTFGGEQIAEEANRLVPVRAGRAVVTSGGNLPARFVFHGVTLGHGEKLSRDLILEIIRSCFYHADTLLLRSIAFPLLGTGIGGFPRDICLDTVFHAVAKTLSSGLTTVEDVRIVLVDPQLKSESWYVT